MKIRVLGCHGSDQAVMSRRSLHHYRSCGFLVNDETMIDAGTIGAALPQEDQAKIQHVLLSHLHFDHIQALPALAEAMSERFTRSVKILGSREVVDGLHRHIFNDHVFPNSSVFHERSLSLRAQSFAPYVPRT